MTASARPGAQQSDIRRFDLHAERLSRKDAEPASRRARRARLEATLAPVSLPPHARILEVGCGAGLSAALLDGRFASYLGIDPAPKLIELAREHHAVPGAEFRVGLLEELDESSSFDLVLAIGVLHHLDHLPAALSRLAGQLVAGGWLAVNEPHPANPLVRWARGVRKRVDRAYSPTQRQLGGGELWSGFAAAGLVDVSLHPQGFLSTPFAEVVFGPRMLMRPLAAAACAVDRVLERAPGPWARRLSWNLIAIGRRPATTLSGP